MTNQDLLSHKIRVTGWILLVIFFAYAGFLLLQSPNSPFSKVPEYTDSGVFQYIGKGILNGIMPYKDAFDHKGPLLYLLNALGFMIAGRQGIWLIEWILLFLTMVLAYRMCRVFFPEPASFAAIILTFSLLGLYLKGGNFTEEYAMLPCAAALLIFANYFKKKRISGLRLFLLGVSFMSALLLKANMTGVWVVFCVYLFIWTLRKKQWRELLRYIRWFLFGSFCVFFPIGLWLLLNHAGSEFISAYLLFNLTYVKAKGTGAMLDAAVFFLDFTMILMLLAGVLAPILVYRKKRNAFRFVLLNTVYLFFAFLLMIMPGNNYIHYGLYYMPAMPAAIAAVADSLKKRSVCPGGEDKSPKKPVANAVGTVLLWLYAAALAVGVLVPDIVNQINEIRVTLEASEEQENLIASIKQLTTKKNRILVIGNECWIYNHADRLAANKYIFQAPLIWISDEIRQDYETLVQADPPDLIVAQGDASGDADICSFYHVSLVDVQGHYRLYKS